MENKKKISSVELDKKKSIWAWSIYDWANSAFATTVMAGFFPNFFRDFWASSLKSSQITFALGLANSLASLLLVIIAPFLGAVADKMAGKKKFLFSFAFLGILSTGMLYVVKAGYWQFALILFICGTIGFSGANIFYDSLLPGVASEKKIDFVSSLGFSLGYIGGGILFAVNVVMFLFMEDGELAIKLSFISVAVWWAIFSIPIMLFVKEPSLEEKKSLGSSMKEGWVELKETFADIRHLKYVGMFLLAYWFYIDGVDTIIRMAVNYGGSLGFEIETMITALLLTQFVAFPATLLYNKFSQKIGIKNGLLVAILAYCCITILGIFISLEWHFFLLACFIGCFQGGIQALSRSLYSRIIPVNKSGEFYGFFNMLGKFAAVIGPLLMGLVELITDNPRIGISSILILFIVGFFLLLKVDIEAGEKMAQEFLGQSLKDLSGEDLSEE
jgi:UMF1 family MFS transporter